MSSNDKLKISDSAQLSLVIYQPPAELPVQERPSARLLREGAAACNTVELLQVLIGGNDAERVARDLLSQCQDLRGMVHKSVLELSLAVHGLGESKAARLKACLELGRRLMLQASEQRLQIRTPSDAAQLLMPTLGLLEQEEVWVVLLDSRNRVIATAMIYRGALNSANMRICEVFREAIRQNACSLVISHNHPSMDPTPSVNDIHVTKELVKAGRILDLEVVDHLVIGGTNSFVSLKERGLGFE